MGLGTVTDGLSSILHNIYQDGVCSWDEMFAALDADFAGHEPLHHRFLEQTPKYGNDDDRADALVPRVFESFWGMIDGRPNARGGTHRVDMLPTTCHVYFGKVTGALPDGKIAGETVSEGMTEKQTCTLATREFTFSKTLPFGHLLALQLRKVRKITGLYLLLLNIKAIYCIAQSHGRTLLRSGELRILVVIHCFRKTGSSIRIISARRAGTKEQKPYSEKKS